MSIENRHNIADEVKKGVEDVRDSADAAIHRSAADAERERREIEGDTMTPGEKVTSAVDEAKERTKAGIDDAKRNIRDHT